MKHLSGTALHMRYAFGWRLSHLFGTNGSCRLDVPGHNASVRMGRRPYIIITIIMLQARLNDSLPRFRALNRRGTRVPHRILGAESQWHKREGEECAHNRQDPPDRQHPMITT